MKMENNNESNNENKNQIPSYSYTSYKPKYEREQKPPRKKSSAGLSALVLVLCLILSISGGAFAGYYAAKANFDESNQSPETILYQSVVREISSEAKSKDQPLSVSQVSALVSDSVVEITTESISTSSFMRQYVTEGAGSGVIISEDGLIATNYHVIEGATSIKVTLHNKEEYTAVVKGYDAQTDVAIIAIEAKSLSPAILGNSSLLEVGEWIVIIGNPLGELGGSVSTGVISALARDVYVDDTPMRLLQTDAAVNPGNSGGGMFNLYGELVGLVNAKSQGEAIDNIGFAIPIDSIKEVIEQLINYGYVQGRPYLGFTTVDVNNTFAAMQYRVSELGVYVLSIEKGTNAEVAGLKSGDLVLAVNGKDVESGDDITEVINALRSGDSVTFTVKRSGYNREITFELEEMIPDDIVR